MTMKEMQVEARLENLEEVMNFVREQLEDCGCSPRQMMQIEIAVEEIYVNIAHYAYHPKTGDAIVRCEVLEEPLRVTIQFLDGGRPYNPLLRADPDVTASAKEREVGGLGIYMAKKSMDGIEYSYENGKNILTIMKFL